MNSLPDGLGRQKVSNDSLPDGLGRQKYQHRFDAPLDWEQTIRYIGRYENDQTHAVAGGRYRQVLGDNQGYFLVEIAPAGKQEVSASIVKGRSSPRRQKLVERLIERTFGPDEELLAFYQFASNHDYLSTLVKRFYGLRIVGVINLWECLAWSIIGQQVSVASAFATRSRLAHHTGAVVNYQQQDYTGFSVPAAVLSLTSEELRACGFSRQKAEYIQELAAQFLTGALDENDLHSLPLEKQRERLLQIRGIGPWSADYAMMRVHADPDSCPYEDIGLRNALRSELNISHQPSMAETERLTASWRPYRAYATFYIWFTLLDKP